MSFESFPTLRKVMDITGAVAKSDETLMVAIGGQQREVPILLRREQYRAQILPDVHPVGVTASKIEDIFSRWLQTLSDAVEAALRLDGQNAMEIVESILERGEAAVIREGDEKQVVRILAKWMAESYAVWPGDDARLKGSITEAVSSVQPLHLIVAHLWPTTVPDYGRLLFPLLTVDGDGRGQDLTLVRALREYFGRTERLGLFGDLVYHSFHDEVPLPDEPRYKKIGERFAPPYCLPHAHQLQHDIKQLLGKFQEDLHRSVLIEWLQNLIAVHLALYYVRIAHAVNDDVAAFFNTLADLRKKGLFDSTLAPPAHCSEKCGNDILACKYRSRMAVPLWLQDGLPPPDASSRQRPAIDDDAMYNLALSIILISRVRDLMRSFYLDDSDALWTLRDCLDMYADDPGFGEYFDQAALLQAAHYLDLSSIDEHHREEKWGLARQSPAGAIYMFYRFVADDYATVPLRTDRAPANIGKFYRQLARNQDRGFLALHGSSPRYGTWYYRLHDDLLTLMVHLTAAELGGKPTIAQLEERLESVYGLRVSETQSGTDPNEQALRRRLQGLGMFRTVSDAREAQFIEPVFAV